METTLQTLGASTHNGMRGNTMHAKVTANITRLYIFIHLQTRDKDGNARHIPHAKPKADGLIIHIHGGGFVAQSSKSHEVGILRSSTKLLDCDWPILVPQLIGNSS